MPYLSLVRINPLRSGAQPLLKNPHRMKIQVLGGVPDPSPDAPVLWRLDAHDPHRPHLLVLTHEKPSWDHIVERVGWPGADGEDFLVRDYEPLLAQLAVGREFAFRLTANPVQNTTRPENPTRHQKEVMEKAASDPERKRLRGFRMGHRTARHQMGWLLRRAAGAGFEIPLASTAQAGAPGMPAQGEPAPDVQLKAGKVLRFHKKASDRRGNRPPVTLITATFEGRLRVTDPDLLRTTLLSGLGPAKRYGCGLLTLAPLTETGSDG